MRRITRGAAVTIATSLSLFACADGRAPLDAAELQPLGRCSSADECIVVTNGPRTCCGGRTGQEVAIHREQLQMFEDSFSGPSGCSDCPLILPNIAGPEFHENRYDLACQESQCTITAEHTFTGRVCAAETPCPPTYECREDSINPSFSFCFFVGVDQ